MYSWRTTWHQFQEYAAAFRAWCHAPHKRSSLLTLSWGGRTWLLIEKIRNVLHVSGFFWEAESQRVGAGGYRDQTFRDSPVRGQWGEENWEKFTAVQLEQSLRWSYKGFWNWEGPSDLFQIESRAVCVSPCQLSPEVGSFGERTFPLGWMALFIGHIGMQGDPLVPNSPTAGIMNASDPLGNSGQQTPASSAQPQAEAVWGPRPLFWSCHSCHHWVWRRWEGKAEPCH